MTVCSPRRTMAPVPPPPPTPPLGPVPPGGTRLITDPTDRGAGPTLNRETDARTAITRGLAEYIGQLVVEINGREVQFKQVFDTFPDVEDDAVYPAAIVWSEEEGRYDHSKFTEQLQPENRLPPPDDDKFLASAAEYVLDARVEAWATDGRQRAALVAMLEDAFSPVLFTGAGVRLELPHYFNQRAEFVLMSGGYVDGDEQASRRFRAASVVVRGRVPVVRVIRAPTMLVRTRVTVNGSP